MAWRDRLRAASWRGVPFEVDATSLEVGRRVVVHEFVQRDVPYAEDMGRSKRMLRLQAFIVGDDYDARRDALIAALEEPGSGILVHPFLGRLSCSLAKPTPIAESKDEGGLARFDLEFVESGTLLFPRVTIDAPTQVATLAAAASSAANASVANNSPLLVPNIGIFSASSSAALLSILRELATITGLPLVDLATASGSPGFRSILASVTDIWRLLAVARVPRPTLAASTLPASDALEAYLDVWFVRLQVDAMGVACELALAQEYESWEALEGVRASLIAILSLAEESTTDAATYDAIVDLRLTTSMGLGDIGERLPREQRLTLAGVSSVLEVAYELYEDPDRDQEIIRRNNILHPCFASGALTVLSR